MKLNIEKLKTGGKLSAQYIKKAHEKPGGSNVGKKTFADGSKRTGPYAGPSGGAPKGSYPIPDVKHAKSALKLAHNAPNPGGIKAAVYRKYPGLKKHAIGGSVTPMNTYWGWDQPSNNYTNDYKTFLTNSANNPSTVNSWVKEANIPYIKSKEDILKYGMDVKRGDFHNFLVKKVPIKPDYQGTYVNNWNNVRPITQSEYRTNVAKNPKFGSGFEADYTLPIKRKDGGVLYKSPLLNTLMNL